MAEPSDRVAELKKKMQEAAARRAREAEEAAAASAPATPVAATPVADTPVADTPVASTTPADNLPSGEAPSTVDPRSSNPVPAPTAREASIPAAVPHANKSAVNVNPDAEVRATQAHEVAAEAVAVQQIDGSTDGQSDDDAIVTTDVVAAATVAPITAVTPTSVPPSSNGAGAEEAVETEGLSAEELAKREMSRRELLTYAWGGALALVAGATGVGLFQFMYPRFRAGEFGGEFFVPLAGVPAADAPPDAEPGGKFWLVQTEEGDPRAIYMVCTHLGCLYKWEPSTFRFECPCHGSKFSKDGYYIEGPAPRSLDTFATRVEGDILVVDTGSKALGAPAAESPARADGVA